MSSDPSQTPPVHHYQHDPERTELERVISAFQKRIEPYFNQLLIGVVVLAVAAAVGIYWSRASRAVSTVGWKEFAAAKTPSEFQELAEKYSTAPVANWALLEAGRRYSAEGLQTALTNREASDESLASARSAFRALLDKGNKVPAEIREEALFGLAVTLEGLAGENIDEAITAYKALQTEFPQSRHAQWVAARLKELEKPDAQEFYAWFRQQNIKQEDRPLPRDLQLPGFPLPPPADGQMLPDLSLFPPPPADPLETPAEGTSPPAPAPPADAPTSETPAAEPATPEAPPSVPETTPEPATPESTPPAAEAAEESSTGNQ